MAKWFLSLENFKSIRQLERLEGRPITLLLGPNNAGKTSVLQALLLLKGSLAYPEAVLSFRNDLVDLGSFRDTVTQGHEEEGISIELGEEENNKAWSFFLRVDTLEGTLQIRGCDVVSEGSRFEYLRSPSSEETSAMYSDPREGVLKGRQVLEGLRWRSFIPYSAVSRRLRPSIREPQWFLNLLQYIGPLRVYPERSYRSQPPPGLDVGIDGRWAPHLLRGATAEQLGNLRYWLGAEGFGLVTNLRARDVEGLPNFVVEVNVQGQWVNLRDVGFGMSQLLPIVVESILVPAKSWRGAPLLLLEQPEIHLHPKAQADLGAFITEMSRKGRRYLIETHSEYLLMRLATEVRRGKLLPDDIAIYFLSLDEQGHTQFRYIPLEEDGRLPPPDEWPEGFFDTDIKEADAFLFASLEQAEV
ncbi:MAG: DUF3696 domain-containing protein [Anaerolineae bacterium]|nr:DUF3696 domain-containing protein [Anaerolineae bacterium]